MSVPSACFTCRSSLLNLQLWLGCVLHSSSGTEMNLPVEGCSSSFQLWLNNCCFLLQATLKLQLIAVIWAFGQVVHDSLSLITYNQYLCYNY